MPFIYYNWINSSTSHIVSRFSLNREKGNVGKAFVSKMLKGDHWWFLVNNHLFVVISQTFPVKCWEIVVDDFLSNVETFFTVLFGFHQTNNSSVDNLLEACLVIICCIYYGTHFSELNVLTNRTKMVWCTSLAPYNIPVLWEPWIAAHDWIYPFKHLPKYNNACKVKIVK